MRQKLSEWLRWKIARWFDRYDDTCWAELVMLAMEDGDIRDVFYLRGSAGKCARWGETPYCGKCAVTGYGGMLFLPGAVK